MRGRKPRPQLHRDDEPTFTPAAPTCPPSLKGEARKEWRRVVRQLLDLGTLSPLDRSTLAAHCLAWARLVEAERMIAETGGEVIRGPSGAPMQNPWRTVANQAAKQLHERTAELGLSPAARARLMPPKPKTKETPSRWAGLLAGVN